LEIPNSFPESFPPLPKANCWYGVAQFLCVHFMLLFRLAWVENHVNRSRADWVWQI